MHFIEGVNRHQLQLSSLEDNVSCDHPVRLIDAFVDNINLFKIGIPTTTLKVQGRPSHHPSTVLKLYLYGYLDRIRNYREKGFFVAFDGKSFNFLE